MQRSRALVYTFAFFVGAVAKLLGVVGFEWLEGALFIAVADLSALVFILLYRAGVTSLARVPLEALWMACDVAIVTWAVYLSGGSSSWWVVWYLANSAAAAFVGGLPTLLAVMGANAFAYIGLIVFTEHPSALVVTVALGRMVLLYGASFFALLAILRLRRKRRQLRDALADIDRLEGLLPICSYCKKIRSDKDYWEQVEAYLSSRSKLEFSHGICPECYETRVRPELEALERGQKGGD